MSSLSRWKGTKGQTRMGTSGAVIWVSFPPSAKLELTGGFVTWRDSWMGMAGMQGFFSGGGGR